MKTVGGYLKKFKAQVILGPIFKFLEAVLELLNPIFMARIIDVGINNSDKPYIIKFTLILVVCNILGFLFAITCQKCASIASTGIAEDIRNDMYETINNFSHNEIDSFAPSSIITRITKPSTKLLNTPATITNSLDIHDLLHNFLSSGIFLSSSSLHDTLSIYTRTRF